MADTDSGNVDNGPVGDVTYDYSSYDWKTIMKAIVGSSATNDTADVQSGQALSNPQTLQDAANVFDYVELVLQDVAESLGDQTQALAGPDGPWQGAAAQSFTTTMESLSKQVTAMANVLSGGVTGDENVPQQLADNAQHLREAIAKIQDIDVWYANQAIKLDPSLQMDNGLVMVSKAGDIPTMMANDMRQVLVALAKHYKLNVDAIVQPQLPTDPANNGAPQQYQGQEVPAQEVPGEQYEGVDTQPGYQPVYGSYNSGVPDQYQGVDTQPGYQPAYYGADSGVPDQYQGQEVPAQEVPGEQYEGVDAQPGYQPAYYGADSGVPDQYEGVDTQPGSQPQYYGVDNSQPRYYGVDSGVPDQYEGVDTQPGSQPQYYGVDNSQPRYYGVDSGVPDQYQGVNGQPVYVGERRSYNAVGRSQQMPAQQPAYYGTDTGDPQEPAQPYDGWEPAQYQPAEYSQARPLGQEVPADGAYRSAHYDPQQPPVYASRIPADQYYAQYQPADRSQELPLGQEVPAGGGYEPAQYDPQEQQQPAVLPGF